MYYGYYECQGCWWLRRQLGATTTFIPICPQCRALVLWPGQLIPPEAPTTARPAADRSEGP